MSDPVENSVQAAEAPQADATAQETATLTAAPAETPPAAPETAQDGVQEGGDKAQTLELKLDASDFAGIAGEVAKTVEAGLAEIRAHVDAELSQFASHFEARLDALTASIAGIDPEQLEQFRSVLKESGVADLQARLTKLELTVRQFA